MRAVSYWVIPNASSEIASARLAVFGNLKEKEYKEYNRRKKWPKESCVTPASPAAGFACLPADQIENNGPRKSHRDQYQKDGDLIDWHIVL